MSIHRKANVRIENRTGQRVLSVSVAHKYSDNYKNTHDWHGPINNESQTNPDMDMVVNYNTGWTTTGRDWWVVSWVTEDGKTYITDPSNFSDIIDFLGKTGWRISAPLASLTTALSLAPEPIISKSAAAAVAVTSLVVGGLCNTESTSGFKQHILREGDSPTIIILKSNEVEFHSKSGESFTVATVIKC